MMNKNVDEYLQSGVLIDAVNGANAPELQRKIMSNLEQEKKILKEGCERIEVILKIFCCVFLLN